ncbi:MAG: flagellar motor switch protein FliN [Sedimentisphaerales bacterium]|nr:flagellar motor switch protein FliN [Sedimentisphaerales bacterium]
MSEEEKVDTVEQPDDGKAEDVADVQEPSAKEPLDTGADAEVKESAAGENTDSDAVQGGVSSDDQSSDDSPSGDSPAADSPADEASSSGEAVPPLPDFSGMLSDAAANSIDLLNDVELNVKIELGRAEMTVEEILRMSEGAVVELNKLAGDPVDILVNEQLVARGEVLVVNDNFCVRVNEIIPGISEQVGPPAVNQQV